VIVKGWYKWTLTLRVRMAERMMIERERVKDSARMHTRWLE
jgi:hypothetical protein